MKVHSVAGKMFKQKVRSAPCSSGAAHRSWTCYNFVGLDLEHNTGNSSQVRQRRLTLRRNELEISQQVASKQKELHFGNRLPQAESSPPSKRHESTRGAASSLQKALWKRTRKQPLRMRSAEPSERNVPHRGVRAGPGLKLYGSDQTAGSWWAPKRLGMMTVSLGMK